jgi:hypothetical protein
LREIKCENITIKSHKGLMYDVNQIIIIIFIEINFKEISSEYIYPDEDLCLLKNFPHKQLVIPSMFILGKVEC